MIDWFHRIFPKEKASRCQSDGQERLRWGVIKRYPRRGGVGKMESGRRAEWVKIRGNWSSEGPKQKRAWGCEMAAARSGATIHISIANGPAMETCGPIKSSTNQEVQVVHQRRQGPRFAGAWTTYINGHDNDRVNCSLNLCFSWVACSSWKFEEFFYTEQPIGEILWQAILQIALRRIGGLSQRAAYWNPCWRIWPGRCSSPLLQSLSIEAWKNCVFNELETMGKSVLISEVQSIC